MFFLFDRQLIYCKKVSKPPRLARPVPWSRAVKGWGSCQTLPLAIPCVQSPSQALRDRLSIMSPGTLRVAV